MKKKLTLSVIAPPLLLLAVVCAAAGAVQIFAKPKGGLQLPLPMRDESDLRIHTGGTAYPREAIDSDGITVRIAKPAHRIVSQFWSIDDFVYSVAPPESVIAVSQSAYLPDISNVYPMTQKFHPVVATDVEKVVALDPDLILVSSTGRADYTSLARGTGAPVYRLETNFKTLEQVEQTIRLTGYLTGNDERADGEAARFHAAIEQAAAMHAQGGAKPRILGIGGRYGYGKDTLFDDIVTKLGGINVGAEQGLKGYNGIDFEEIIRWDPEWIFAEADQGKERETLENLLIDPAISLTQAARNGHIVVLPNNVFLPMSPYTTLLVKAMAEALYGGPAAVRERSH
jgi:iron complex transport system substrate-binding protein